MTGAPGLVAISPGDHGTGRDLARWIEALGQSGLRTLVIREPHLDDDALDALVLGAWAVIPELVVHDRSPRARSYGLPLHLAADAPLRGWQGPWSRSCHSATAVDAALTEGAGWVTLSPVHRPRSKPDDRRPPLGLDGFLSIASDRPVVALGGMDVERVAALAQAGGAGAAVCGALFGRANPAEAARACEALLQALDRAA